MTIGPFKINEEGKRVELCTKNNKTGKIRVTREEVLAIISTIVRMFPEGKASILGANRFGQNEIVTYTVQDNTLRFTSTNDACSCTFTPGDRDAVVNFEKNVISIADASGAAITLCFLDKHSLPVDLYKMIPDNINCRFTRGESLMFTGPLAKVRVDLTEQSKQRLTTAVTKETTHITWLTMAAITEAAHLCKCPFVVTGLELTPAYDASTNMCTVDGKVVISPESAAVTPAVYIEEIKKLLTDRLGQIKNTPCEIEVYQLPDSQDACEFYLHVEKGVRVFDVDIIKANSNYASEKLIRICEEAHGDLSVILNNTSHYTVPVKCTEGNSVYLILVGIGLTKLAAIADTFNKFSNELEEPIKSTVLEGTESWMVRINFKGQTL